jgi:hypothetical protein
VAKSYLPVATKMGKILVRTAPGSSSFFVDGPSSSARSGRAISVMGYLVPQPFTDGGNRAVSRFFVS